MAKHQQMAPTRMISGTLAIQRKAIGMRVRAIAEGDHGEQADADEGGEDRQDVRLVQAGLEDDDDDRPQVLEDEQAEGDAAGHRVEFEGFLEQLDDEQRRRTGDDDADVERAEALADHAGEADEQQALRHEEAEDDDERI